MTSAVCTCVRLVRGCPAGRITTCLRAELFAGRAGFRGQDDAGAAGRGEGSAAGATLGGLYRVQRRPGLSQEHPPGIGQGDRTAGAFQQRRPKAPFELADRPRQRGLRDPEPLRGPSEMQLLGDGDEVPQLPRLHAVMVFDPPGIDTRAVSLPTPIGVGRLPPAPTGLAV